MIKPTVGRVVWFYEHAGQAEPLAATVTKVWNDRMVNLTVHSEDGSTHGRTSVFLKQPGETIPSGPHCEWMPYQLGQAAKTEEAERRAADPT